MTNLINVLSFLFRMVDLEQTNWNRCAMIARTFCGIHPHMFICRRTDLDVVDFGLGSQIRLYLTYIWI